ncbi:MAG: serine/threonine-protein kinase [Nannocystaceae bacterium]
MSAQETLPDTGRDSPLAMAPPRDPVEARSAFDAVAARMFGATPQALRIGRFVLLHKLGSGGMGVVHAAYDEQLDRKVALKLLHEQAGEGSDSATAGARLLHEARAAARLVHPNVVAIHEVGTWCDQVFLAMEFVDGPTLRGWAKQPRTRAEILEVFAQAGRGLAAAHAAGVVHRDFKPENVLVGTGPDGRPHVRVVDFGLARASQRVDVDVTVPDAGVATPAAAGLTGALGAIAGTPAYMAPEQHLGAVVDARCDQFAFCVALWEVLFGQRPFAGETLEALATAVLEGRITEPADARVPTWLRRILRQGLRTDPAQRHASMDALLSALTRDPARRRRRIAVGLLGGAGLLALGAAIPRGAAGDDPCAGGRARVDTVWGAAQRERLQAAFAATARPWAAAAASRAGERLDAQADAWVAMHREACEATRVRGEQSDALLELRMACLDRRLAELGSLATLLGDADAEVVTQVERPLGALVPISACADVEALRTQVALPEDPEAREAIAAIEDEITRGAQLRDLGRYQAAAELGLAMVAKAQALGHDPTLADAQALVGATRALAGDAAGARSMLESAIWSAIAGRNAAAQAAAAIALVTLVGHTQGDAPDAARWAALARATLRAMGDPPQQLGALEGNLGNVAMAAGDRARAAEHFRESMRLFTVALGPDDARVGRMAANLAVALRQQGELDAAEQAYGDALRILGAALGPGHPDLGPVLSNWAGLLFHRGRFEQALARYREALAIEDAALPPHHPQLGHVHNNIAETLLELGELDAAANHAHEAIDIWERSLGSSHVLLAHALVTWGRAVCSRGDPLRAEPALRRAVALRDAPGVARADSDAAARALATCLATLPEDERRRRAASPEAPASR